MGTLAYNDLLKPATKKEPIPRITKFIEKMSKGSTFEMADGSQKYFSGKVNAANLAKLQKIKITGEPQHRAAFNTLTFIDEEKQSFKLTKFKKTAEFGGGAGSGGGADLTKFSESGQCYVCSLVFNVLKRPIETAEDWSRLDDEDVVKYCDTGNIKLMEIAEKLGKDEVWTVSMIRVANLLYKDYKTKFKSPVYFHRNSVFMKRIYNDGMKKCMEKNPVPIVGTFNENKWNPGDIWMTTLNESQQAQLKFDTNTWVTLNRQIQDLAEEGKLLGVSLKKVTGIPTKEITNDMGKEKTPYTFKGYRVSATGKSFFGAIDIYLDISGKEVQYRATATTKSWQGEVKELAAAGGKIGGIPTNNYLKAYSKGKVGVYEVKEEEITAETKKSDFMEKFYALYKKYYKPPSGQKILELEDFSKMAKAKDKESPGSFFFSKYAGLKMIDILMKSSPEQRDEIANALMKYAQSKTDQSSYFVKIK
jgi:hypothetical protein